MTMSATTSSVYTHVMEDVLNKVRQEFINNAGPGESVLNELQGIWETKMMQAGVKNPRVPFEKKQKRSGFVSHPLPDMQASSSTPAIIPPPTDPVEQRLNEDDDDYDALDDVDLDDVDQGEDDLKTQHLGLAQFDKVTRMKSNKSRWKCTLRDGIMHINDKEILFNKATGVLDF